MKSYILFNKAEKDGSTTAQPEPSHAPFQIVIDDLITKTLIRCERAQTVQGIVSGYFDEQPLNAASVGRIMESITINYDAIRVLLDVVTDSLGDIETTVQQLRAIMKKTHGNTASGDLNL